MSEALYTAQAHIVGGRNGRGRTSDGQLDLDLRQPKELGGDGAGANPEQLFAIGAPRPAHHAGPWYRGSRDPPSRGATPRSAVLIELASVSAGSPHRGP
jgi:hypothetical protein